MSEFKRLCGNVMIVYGVVTILILAMYFYPIAVCRLYVFLSRCNRTLQRRFRFIFSKIRTFEITTGAVSVGFVTAQL